MTATISCSATIWFYTVLTTSTILQTSVCLTSVFIRGMISRKCGIEDVSQFVGCEAIAYGNLETVVLGLAERADELDIDDVEADPALYGSAEVISYLKAVDAEFNYRVRKTV